MLNIFYTQATNNHWQQVARSFADTKGRQPTSDLLYITIASVILLLVISWIWKFLSSQRKAAWITGIITSPRKIAQIMDQAMVCRSRFDLGFYPAQTARPSTPCALTEFTEDSLTLEMPFGVTPSTHWVGRNMLCYFYILQDNKTPVFYKFFSTITEVYKVKAFYYVVLDMPTTMELEQKRKHLRLNIPSGDIKNLRLWSATEDSSFHFEKDRSLWPLEFSIYSPDQEEKLCIVDISGGGIGLAINPKHHAQLSEVIAQNRILFIHLELKPAGTLQLPPYFLAARLRSKIKDYPSGMMLLGYEFVEYSLDKPTEDLQWVKINPEQGIDELITWVFKRHLELYREQKID